MIVMKSFSTTINSWKDVIDFDHLQVATLGRDIVMLQFWPHLFLGECEGGWPNILV